MKNKIINNILIIICIFIITGCNYKKELNINTNDNIEEKNNEVIEEHQNEVINSVKILINDKEYIINLEDNETTKALINLLPLELNMNELNGNEKYVNLDNNLPTNSSNPNHINTGDVMLFSDNCLVIFYKSFDTPYSYTKIGHIDNLPDLGNGNIKVKIEK